MSHHSVQIVQEETTDRWRVWCSCKSAGGIFPTKGDAEEWEFRHHRLVEQARVHLRDKTPTLLDQFKWYAAKAEDPNLPREERDQWQMLADGIAHRVGVQSTEGDEALPFDVNPLYRQPKRKGSQ